MAGHRELTKDVDIDIRVLFSNIWKKKLLIMFLSLMAGAAIFMVMNSIAPRYQTTAQLIIEPRESQFTRVEQQNGGINANDFDNAAVLSQVQIIFSDEIALNTIRKLQLETVPEFGTDKEPSILTDLFVLIGLRNKPLNISPQNRVLSTFKKRLKAYSIEESRVIEILFWANDPELATLITNTVAEEYLKLQRKSKLDADINATSFLEPEIADLRNKVRAAEAKVAEFRSNSDILLGNNNALLATQQLSETATELSRVRAQGSAAQAKVDSVRSTLDIGASLEAIPEVVASPLIQRLRERQVELRARISELSTALLPAHPRLKALKSQVSDFENQIHRETRGILRSLENNVVIAHKQQAALVEELGRLKAEAARAGEAEVEMRALEREAISERELLKAYMAKFREAAGRQSSKYVPINARIISAAHLPTDSYFPKTIPYTIAGTIVTAILGMVAILAVSLLNGDAFISIGETRVKGVDEDEFASLLEKELDELPKPYNPPDPVVTPPSIDLDDIAIIEASRPVEDHSMDEIQPAVSISLTAEGLLGLGNSRIAILSPGGDEGSVSTWLLARKLSRAGKSVAVMDMTGSGITTRQMLGTMNLVGVRDLLAGSSQVSECIHRDPQSTTSVLPVGINQPRDADAAGMRLEELVSALSENFDYLIIDCGFAIASDLARIANKDTVILISTIASDEGALLETELLGEGYAETISVHPTREELLSDMNIAA